MKAPSRGSNFRFVLTVERAKYRATLPRDPIVERLFAIDDLIRTSKYGVSTKDVLTKLAELYADWDGLTRGADAAYRKARRDLVTLFEFRPYEMRVEEGEKRYYFMKG